MYSIPDTSIVKAIADWVELHITYTNSEISKSELQSYIEASSGSEPCPEDIDNVWLELETRERLYGTNPPYMVQGNIVTPNISWKKRPDYMACLIFALEGNPFEPAKSGKLFEHITNIAVKNFLEGESMTVGSPRAVKVERIARILNERYASDPPGWRQDRKLDVVAWKPFNDGRCSQIIMLIQCKAGHDWHEKLGELSEFAWCRYINFASKPTKGFSIPVIISDRDKLEDDSADAGVIIDRARIYRNITDSSLTKERLRTKLERWCTGSMF